MKTNDGNERENRFTIPLINNVNNDIKYARNTGVLDNIVGQSEAKRQLSFYIAQYSEQNSFPNFIFTGSQGLGKTFFARKVAESIGRELVEINCSTIKTVEDFMDKVLLSKVLGEVPKTIFFDEAHALSQEIVDALLSLLDINEKNKNYLNTKKGLDLEYDMSKINAIFATTDAHLIFKPLLNRLEEVYFHAYSNEEIFKILCSYLPDVKITCDKEDIAYAARGRARDAVKLSRKIRMFCQSNNVSVFDNKKWQYIKETFGIHAYGLTDKEIEFMKILSENPPLSSASLALKMGVNVSNIEEEIEIRPKELGFVSNSTRGRVLTDEGRKYLKGKV